MWGSIGKNNNKKRPIEEKWLRNPTLYEIKHGWRNQLEFILAITKQTYFKLQHNNV